MYSVPFMPASIGRSEPQGAVNYPSSGAGGYSGQTDPGFSGPVMYVTPQGVFGPVLGQMVGREIGKQFGQGQIGEEAGRALGQLLPFHTQPMTFAPQGPFGVVLGTSLGRLVGNHFGDGNAGGAIGGAAGTFLPFSALPFYGGNRPPLTTYPTPYTPFGGIGVNGPSFYVGW